jgi:hypothetical protein
MHSANERAAFHRIVDPFLEILTRDQAKSICEYSVSQAIQDRVEQLASVCPETVATLRTV